MCLIRRESIDVEDIRTNLFKWLASNSTFIGKDLVLQSLGEILGNTKWVMNIKESFYKYQLYDPKSEKADRLGYVHFFSEEEMNNYENN